MVGAISVRQKQILDQILQEYILSAEPVSSHLLKEKCNFGFCPATIRNEMQKLTEQGYLEQPHTSAGRVPTDKAYRFFVDNLAKANFDKSFVNEFQEIGQGIEDVFRLAQLLVKNLSSVSLNLTISYLPEENLLLKEGWEQVFQGPEFKDFNYGLRFLKLVQELEEEIRDFEISEDESLKIYIGRENPISEADDFSMLVSGCRFAENQDGILLILGPKRMAYDKNIALINSVTKLLELL